MDDPNPDTGVFRGWADLVAIRLAEDTPDFRYANLAIRGRLFDNIVEEQVPPTLRMQPDLISFAAGGNDALRRGFEPARVDRPTRPGDRHAAGVRRRRAPVPVRRRDQPPARPADDPAARPGAEPRPWVRSPTSTVRCSSTCGPTTSFTTRRCGAPTGCT